jgi:hypothetical protein
VAVNNRSERGLTADTKLQLKNKPAFSTSDSIICEISRYKQVAPIDFSSDSICTTLGFYTVNELNNNNTDRASVPATASPGSDHWWLRAMGALSFVAAAALFSLNSADARWYKWVDESGNISYQDKPPPANYDESTQVLNSHGVTVKRIPSAEEERQMAQQKELEYQRQKRDQALIKSFPSEEDLLRTREKRIGHIDATVSRMHDQLVILNNRLVSIENKINYRKSQGMRHSTSLDSDRVAVIRSINSTNALIKSKLKERRQVAAKFDSDLDRYRELFTATDSASLDE